jgi:hypothetical protein
MPSNWGEMLLSSTSMDEIQYDQLCAEVSNSRDGNSSSLRLIMGL